MVAARLRVVECGDEPEVYELCVNLPDGPRYADNNTAFDGVTPLGTIWRHGDLTIPSGARQYAFVLGGPLLDDQPQVVCQSDDMEPLLIADLRTSTGAYSRTVMTSRSSDGVAEFEQVASWPTRRLRFGRNVNYSQCKVSDRDGNAGTVQFE